MTKTKTAQKFQLYCYICKEHFSYTKEKKKDALDDFHNSGHYSKAMVDATNRTAKDIW